MFVDLGNRMRALESRIGVMLPGTKMTCALVILLAVVNLFAMDGAKQFSISIDGIISLLPKLWTLFSAPFYEKSIFMVNKSSLKLTVKTFQFIFNHFHNYFCYLQRALLILLLLFVLAKHSKRHGEHMNSCVSF